MKCEIYIVCFANNEIPYVPNGPIINVRKSLHSYQRIQGILNRYSPSEVTNQSGETNLIPLPDYGQIQRNTVSTCVFWLLFPPAQYPNQCWLRIIRVIVKTSTDELVDLIRGNTGLNRNLARCFLISNIDVCRHVHEGSADCEFHIARHHPIFQAYADDRTQQIDKRFLQCPSEGNRI